MRFSGLHPAEGLVLAHSQVAAMEEELVPQWDRWAVCSLVASVQCSLAPFSALLQYQLVLHFLIECTEAIHAFIQMLVLQLVWSVSLG